MGLYSRLFDTSNGKRNLIPYPGFVNESETVSGSPKNEFTLTQTIDADHFIEAWVDGRHQVDTVHFNRDTDENSIIFTENVAIGLRVDIRVYLK